MTFTDDDLKRLKESLTVDAPEDWFDGERTKLEALIARLEAAEKYISADETVSSFDCPHLESPCSCGTTDRQLWADLEEAKKAWRKAAGK